MATAFSGSVVTGTIYTQKRRAIPFYGMTPRQQATK